MWMRSERGVVAVGLVAGVAVALLPEGAVPLVAIAAALTAGALLPAKPMLAAVLVLLPTVVVAVVRAALDSDRNLGGLAMALLGALFIAAILTHVSAGVAVRRQQAARP